MKHRRAGSSRRRQLKVRLLKKDSGKKEPLHAPRANSSRRRRLKSRLLKKDSGKKEPLHAPRANLLKSTSCPAPVPSRANIEDKLSRDQRCVGSFFIYALSGVFTLILLGSESTVSMGATLLLSGTVLILQPPARSIGRWMDVMCFCLLACGLLNFFPVAKWTMPQWRSTAVDVYGIDLPSLVTVQPSISWEGWLMTVATLGWAYTVAGKAVNSVGRKWFYFWFSIGLAIIASLAIVGVLKSWSYTSELGSGEVRLFWNAVHVELLLAIGGVVAFSFAMHGFSHRHYIYIVGFFASVVSLAAITLSQSAIGLVLYFVGIFLWFIFKVRQAKLGWLFKWGLSAMLLFWMLYVTYINCFAQLEFVALSSYLLNAYLVFSSAVALILDAPIAGYGFGDISKLISFGEDAIKPLVNNRICNDYLALAVASGLPPVILLFFGLWTYLKHGVKSVVGARKSLRIVGFIAVVLFILQGFVSTGGHCAGLAFLMALFAALSFPRGKTDLTTLPKWCWRGVGGLFILVGILWIGGQISGWATNSKLANERDVDRWEKGQENQEISLSLSSLDNLIAANPFAWKYYQERARISLELFKDFDRATADFARAAYLAPDSSLAKYQEGLIWLNYDSQNTLTAWSVVLASKHPKAERLIKRMFHEASDKATAMSGLIELSRHDPRLNLELLRQMKGAALDEHIRITLASDPHLSNYKKHDRTEVLVNWIESGDLDTATTFLELNETTLSDSWYLWAILRKNQGRFEDAIMHLREGLIAPQLITEQVDPDKIPHFERDYAATRSDIAKAYNLGSYYLLNQRHVTALTITQPIINSGKAPAQIYYLHAESLYQLGDFIGSWATYVRYLAISRQI
jgi:tetratricopeptide (TPR) repeat protein